MAPELKTERLLLRHWKEEDLPFFATMNADPEVMEFFPSTLSKQESDALAKRIEDELKEENYGLWAVEVPGVAPFIGFIGLHYQDFPASFTPCIEIGWRLAKEFWGKGYGTEGALAALDYAKNVLRIEVYSFTAVKNKRSQKLMERIGLTHNPRDDFEHPKLPQGDPLRPHVLYKLSL